MSPRPLSSLNLTFAGRRLEIARDFREHRPPGNLVQRLAQDLRRLRHLANPHHVAIHRVAELAPMPVANRHVELELGIHRIRDVLADVPLDSARTQIRPDQVVVDGFLRRDHSDVRQPLDINFVPRDQRVVFLENWIEMIEVRERLLAPSGRQVPRHAADSHVVEREPRAAQLLDQIVDHLALANRMRERRHRADIHRHRAHREQMRRDSIELRRDHATVLAAMRHFDSRELLARHAPTLVGEHRAHVIDAIGVRHEAVVADLFRNFLDRPMQVADVGDRLAHHLAVGPHHEAQHPVRRRMLRAHVERHFFGVQRAHFFFVSSRIIGLSLTVEIPWYSAGSTKSLRCG